jgi:prolyl-tRNA synthetase
LLNLKELRLASQDLIKELLPSACSKDDVSPLPLPTPVRSSLHLLLDSTLAGSSAEHAVHLTSSSSTILLKGTDIKLYLESLVGEGEGSGVKVVDFAEMAAAKPAVDGEKKGKEAAA